MTAPDINRFVRILCVGLATSCGTRLSLGQSMGRGQAGFPDKAQVIEKIAVIDEDDRRTEAEYARENGMTLADVQNSFGATGAIKCTGSEGTAQLTLSNSVITTSAHLFYDRDNCRKISDPLTCFFETELRGKRQRYRIKEVTRIGFKCPSVHEQKDDWAVLKLVEGTIGVVPYRLPSNRKYPGSYGDPIIAVSVGARDFYKGGQTKKAIANCIAKHDGIRDDGSLSFLQSNCDSAQGSSGGSLLKKSTDDKYELIAIISGNHEHNSDLNKAVRRHGYNKAPYREGKWSTIGTTVTSDVYDAIVEAAK